MREIERQAHREIERRSKWKERRKLRGDRDERGRKKKRLM